jgi:hypothetical protein
MIYVAAILLTLRDRCTAPVQYAQKGAPLPRYRKRRWLVLWAPLAAFGLLMWLLIYGPVYVWRSMKIVIAKRS